VNASPVENALQVEFSLTFTDLLVQPGERRVELGLANALAWLANTNESSCASATASAALLQVTTPFGCSVSESVTTAPALLMILTIGLDRLARSPPPGRSTHDAGRVAVWWRC
jgi:hypothetical protein